MAEAWARGHQARDDEFEGIAESRRAAGATEEQIEALRADYERQRREQLGDDADREQLVEVWPEHFAAFRVFMACQSDWEWPDSFGGGRLTIPTSEVRATMDALGIHGPEIFGQVKLMIRAAREVLLEKIESARAAARSRRG